MIQRSCETFRRLLRSECLAIPGAFNGLVGRSVAANGFKACYISGAAVSASQGVPDIGLVTLDHFCRVIKEVHISSGLPVLADADTGFGEGEMSAKTVWEYYNSGAAALHIEDQVFPKRCGHLDGKALIPAEDMIKKIEIAVNASRQCSNGEFIICARTDARGVIGIEETIRRAKLYVDAGADMIFPEGLASKEEFALVAKELKQYGSRGGPFLLANMTEFGKTPYISLEEFETMGYNCVIYPVSTLRLSLIHI
eukprot:TRINITY_DN3949_c0_g4_i2.p1 TRINITY_DN3949_c0_g4~~TRINITY_DN3949_c0_g4_i2.p1  ORF type:complete len:254 (-),score=76.66 TRINITY_DN3949_c0_g4_i2:62-823(-)